MRKNHSLFLEISQKIVDYHLDGKIQNIIERYTPKECSSNGAWNKQLPQAKLFELRGLLIVTLVMGFLGLAVVFVDSIVKTKSKGKVKGQSIAVRIERSDE